MVGMMNISNYQAFFHDGSLQAIEHTNDKIIFTLFSAEVDEADIKNDIILSDDDRIVGNLYIEKIKSIIVNDKPFNGLLTKTHDSADIFELDIQKHRIKILIIWSNYPPKPEDEDFSVIEVHGEKIYWENLPDLVSNG